MVRKGPKFGSTGARTKNFRALGRDDLDPLGAANRGDEPGEALIFYHPSSVEGGLGDTATYVTDLRFVS